MAIKERKRRAELKGLPNGIQWNFVPGHYLPPKDRSKANTSNSVRNLWISESLFADDTTACGSRQMAEGKEPLKEVMGWFEERCHPDKEEHLEFGRRIK